MQKMLSPQSSKPLSSSTDGSSSGLTIQISSSSSSSPSSSPPPSSTSNFYTPSRPQPTPVEHDLSDLPTTLTLSRKEHHQPAPVVVQSPPQVIFRDREVVKVVEKVVLKESDPSAAARIPNHHTQLLSDQPSGLLKDEHGRAMREWYGCQCGCGVASLSCNILNQQMVLYSNLQQQYEILQHYVAQLHSGLHAKNIALSDVLPAPVSETRAVIVGSLLTLEACNRNTVRDLVEGVREMTEVDEKRMWAQTPPHAMVGIENQPLRYSREHMTYAKAMVRHVMETPRHVSEFVTSSNVRPASKASKHAHDEDAPDTGLGASLLTSLPVTYANQSVTRTLFNHDPTGQPQTSMRLDLPEVIVCELEEFDTRPRSNAICYRSRADVPELNIQPRTLDSMSDCSKGVFGLSLHSLAASDDSNSRVGRMGRGGRGSIRDAYSPNGRRDHRASLSLGALAAGLQSDPNQNVGGLGLGAPSHAQAIIEDPLTLVLNHPVGFSLLSQQCAHDRSSENLSLWSCVKEFHLESDWVSRIARARDIIHRFIAREAPEQINLPSQVTDEIMHMLKQVEIESIPLEDGLSTAQSIAHKLLSVDSYKRFTAPDNPLGAEWSRYLADHPEALHTPPYQPIRRSGLLESGGALHPSEFAPSSSSSSSSLGGSSIPYPIPRASSPLRATSPPRTSIIGPPVTESTANLPQEIAFNVMRASGLSKVERTMKFNLDSSMLTVHIRTKDGSDGPIEHCFVPHADANAYDSPVDLIQSLKPSRNDPSKLTIFYLNSTNLNSKSPQALKLFVPTGRGQSTSTIKSDRERIVQQIRAYQLVPNDMQQ